MGTFKWDESADQTYGEIYGSQTVHDSTFNKNFGKSFIMDAPDETLTLRYYAKSADISGDEWRWGSGASDYEARETLISVLQGKLIFNGSNANSAIDIPNAWLVFGFGGYPAPRIRVESDGELHLINLSALTAVQRAEEKEARISLLDSARLVVNHEDASTIFNMVMALTAENDAKLNIEVRDLLVYEAINLRDKADASLACSHFELREEFVRVSGNATCSLKAETATASSSFILDEGSGKLVILASSKGDCPFDFALDESLTKGLFDFIHSGKSVNKSVLKVGVLGFRKRALLAGGFIAVNGEPLSEQEIYTRFDVDDDTKNETITFKLKS